MNKNKAINCEICKVQPSVAKVSNSDWLLFDGIHGIISAEKEKEREYLS